MKMLKLIIIRSFLMMLLLWFFIWSCGLFITLDYDWMVSARINREGVVIGLVFSLLIIPIIANLTCIREE